MLTKILLEEIDLLKDLCTEYTRICEQCINADMPNKASYFNGIACGVRYSISNLSYKFESLNSVKNFYDPIINRYMKISVIVAKIYNRSNLENEVIQKQLHAYICMIDLLEEILTDYGVENIIKE